MDLVMYSNAATYLKIVNLGEYKMKLQRITPSYNHTQSV